MSKPGSHKQRYDRYKNSGRKDINKKIKQERAEKRISKFAKRREDGKAYVYSKDAATKKWNDFIKGKDKNYVEAHMTELKHEVFGANVKSKKHTDCARNTSALRKVDNFVEKQKMEDKKRKAS